MTAPTTEQVREAAERLDDALFNHDRFRGGNVPEFIERVRPADIRTILDALAAKDEPEGGPMPPFETPCAECGREWGEHYGEECPNGRTKFRPAPSAPADYESRRGKPGPSPLPPYNRTPVASPVPSVTPSVTDEDVRAANVVFETHFAITDRSIGRNAMLRAVLEDYASRKGADT